MALRVWLPLNGNLDNQGLSNARFTTATATIDNNGKIGKCYSFTATTGIGIYLNAGISVANFMSTYINNHSWTLCAWIITTSTKTTPVFGLTYGLRFWCGASTIIGLYNSSRNKPVWSTGSLFYMPVQSQQIRPMPHGLTLLFHPPF